MNVTHQTHHQTLAYINYRRTDISDLQGLRKSFTTQRRRTISYDVHLIQVFHSTRLPTLQQNPYHRPATAHLTDDSDLFIYLLYGLYTR